MAAVMAMMLVTVVMAGASTLPRGPIYTTIMVFGPNTNRPFKLWFWGPNSIVVVYMDP